jgi:ABC-type transport system involved in multi-copper enzyme maturation permease subunit
MSEYGNYGRTSSGVGFSLGGGRLADMLELLHLSLKLQLGKRFWAYALMPLVWPIFLSVFEAIGLGDLDTPTPGMAQNLFIGVPVYFLAIAIGMQIISSEIEARTLEVCYTVPGGAKRIWLSKLAAALVILVAAILLNALFCRIVFTSFPPAALYRVLQGALFFLTLSMGAGAMFRNKMTAGLASVVAMFFTGAFTGFGEIHPRYTPLFNPLGLAQTMSSEDLLYYLLQNHLGFAMIIVTFVVLTFSRVERRELMLSDD